MNRITDKNTKYMQRDEWKKVKNIQQAKVELEETLHRMQYYENILFDENGNMREIVVDKDRVVCYNIENRTKEK